MDSAYFQMTKKVESRLTLCNQVCCWMARISDVPTQVCATVTVWYQYVTMLVSQFQHPLGDRGTSYI